MRSSRHPRKTCGCGRRHTLVTTVAILLAFGGTAVALPGKSSVNSGDIKNNSVKSVDVKDGTLRSADLGDAAVTAAELATDSVGRDEIAAGTVGAAEIDDLDLTVSDIGSDTGKLVFNFPTVNANTCTSKSVEPVNDHDIGDDVIMVTPGAGFDGPFTVAAEVNSATSFAIKICNTGSANYDPDGTGAVYSWVIFEA